MPRTKPPAARRVPLDLRDEEDVEDVRTNLSVAALTGRCLWTCSDEGARIERLSTADFRGFADHRSFPLSDFLDLPAGGEGEADLEGLDVCPDGPWLWLCGSHSLKRRKPKPDLAAAETLDRLTHVEREPNRFLLARIPLVEDGDGSWRPARRAPDGRAAACLPFAAKGNALTKALSRDPVIAPFLGIPAKENGFDVEGLAVRGERVFLGLRGPVLRGWALILELRVRERKGGRLKLARIEGADGGGGRYRRRFLDLDGLGIRDLVWDGEDLLILSGPTMDLDGPVTLWRWPGALSEPADDAGGSPLVPHGRLVRVLDLPYGRGTDHAEGMCLVDGGAAGTGSASALLVLYDSPAPDRLHRAAGTVDADLFPLP